MITTCVRCGYDHEDGKHGIARDCRAVKAVFYQSYVYEGSTTTAYPDITSIEYMPFEEQRLVQEIARFDREEADKRKAAMMKLVGG